MWTVWFTTVMFVVALLAVDGVARARLVVTGLLAGLTGVVCAAWLISRRVRWKFSLDDNWLHISRIAPGKRERVATLDTRLGIRFESQMDSLSSSLDLHLVLYGAGQRVVLPAELPARAATRRLARFLGAHGVRTEPHVRRLTQR